MFCDHGYVVKHDYSLQILEQLPWNGTHRTVFNPMISMLFEFSFGMILVLIPPKVLIFIYLVTMVSDIDETMDDLPLTQEMVLGVQTYFGFRSLG